MKFRPALIILTVLTLASLTGLHAAEVSPSKTNSPVRGMDGTSADMWGPQTVKTNLVRGEWLKNSRFAMFIHWGLYSQLAGRWNGKTYYGISEWIMNRAKIPAAEYAKMAAHFDPTNFNAQAWVDLAKAAGMNRIVITAKHHEGFAMFNSAASPFNIVAATPFKRDPLKELAAACQADGVRLGFYYSQSQDWHERDAMGNTWDWPEPGRDFQHYLTIINSSSDICGSAILC